MPLNLRHAQEDLRTHLNAATLPRVNFVTTLEDALSSADLAIDCVPDELESKLEIFCLMDRMAPPRTVFATPSVKQSIADLASCTYRPEKCIAILRKAAEFTTAPVAEQSRLQLAVTSRTDGEARLMVEQFFTLLGFTTEAVQDASESML